MPIVQLCGIKSASKRAVAATVCKILGLNLYIMLAQVVPLVPSELENLIRLWTRETILSPSALLIDCDEIDTNDKEPH